MRACFREKTFSANPIAFLGRCGERFGSQMTQKDTKENPFD
jgi:hypothetical protein